MQNEMFKMLQYIASSSTDDIAFEKKLSAMTEKDVREVYMLLKRKKSQRSRSSRKPAGI